MQKEPKGIIRKGKKKRMQNIWIEENDLTKMLYMDGVFFPKDLSLWKYFVDPLRSQRSKLRGFLQKKVFFLLLTMVVDEMKIS